jgi:exosortase C (VPDSG-CTERM-specific)
LKPLSLLFIKKEPGFSPKGAAVPTVFLVALAVVTGCYAIPLWHWISFASTSELFSYTLLVPFVSAYLIATAARANARSNDRHHYALGAFFVLAALMLQSIHWLGKSDGSLDIQDSLSISLFSFVLMLLGASAITLGKADFSRHSFALGFLIFMVPLPVSVEANLEAFLQHGSAPPAYWLLKLAGTPVFKTGMVFQLPGISLQIAPECSGIRSTIVLFITSLIAGKLFLRSAWRRTILTAFVIPLALVRNGFRVFTIGELCVHVGRHMIDSAIHHRGGPIFFALSLIPFFLLLYYLVGRERRAAAPAKPQIVQPQHV